MTYLDADSFVAELRSLGYGWDQIEQAIEQAVPMWRQAGSIVQWKAA